jgi:type I restriction enzyme M protein
MTAGDEAARQSLASAFREAGSTTTVDRAAIEKAIAAGLASLNGNKPNVAKEMLAALTVRDKDAPIVVTKKGPEPDPEPRDTEDVPLRDDVAAYFEREVLPYLPDAWIDESKNKTGYEIPFARHFYSFIPPRPLEDIDAEIRQLEQELGELIKSVVSRP